VPGTRRLLRLLEERGTRATAFVLGSLAAEYPALVREIRAAGHEIAAHGHLHRPVYQLSPQEFRRDVVQAKDVLEGLTGEPVLGYRAPWFSITRRSTWAFEILAEAGFRYDASVLPVHPRFYRVPGWDGAGYPARFPGPIECRAGRLLEIPATTLRIAGLTVPAAGGIYLGILPHLLFARAIRAANRLGQPGVLYLHPHDLDDGAFPPGRPSERVLGRILAAGRRHAESRIRRILGDFPFASVREWLAGAPSPPPR
jgi:polysaccharide deacetylase family protein (PEP-CTERM system associated)